MSKNIETEAPEASGNLQAKKQIVESLAGELTSDSDKVSTVVFDYTGVQVNEINDLREKLAEHGAKLKVVKNTLIKRILEKTGVTIENDLDGQSAILIPSQADIISPLKELFKFIKEFEKGSVKLGVLDGSVIPSEKVESLSKLPSREELLGQVVGGFVSPIRGFMYTLTGVQGNLVRVLSEIQKTKSE